MRNPFALFIASLVCTCLTAEAGVISRRNKDIGVQPMTRLGVYRPADRSPNALGERPSGYWYTPRWGNGFCITWQAIWQHTTDRVDDMTFWSYRLGHDYIIQLYGDVECKDENLLAWVQREPGSATTIAITSDGKFFPTEPTKGQYPADPAKKMKAFRINKVCPNGKMSVREDLEDC